MAKQKKVSPRRPSAERKKKAKPGKRELSAAEPKDIAPTAGALEPVDERATVERPVERAPAIGPAPRSAPVTPFPIVGVGASAGGLEAFTQLLAQLPADTGMAFVLIQHLDPSHKSFLDEALARATRMPVSQLQRTEVVLPNHVYVTPPAADISIQGDSLVLVSRWGDPVKPSLHLPIDSFFSDLAAARGSRAIGVVLSGNASDGTEGLRAIRVAGGITIAQDPKTAKFEGMPQNAIRAGVVDYALPISGVAKELVRLSRHPYLADPVDPADPAVPAELGGVASTALPPALDHREAPRARGGGRGEPASDEGTVLARIKKLVMTVVGVDFGEYKSPTFERRLARRMALRRIEDPRAYLALLGRDPGEVRALYEDTLIHVSAFFRDPEVFESLKAKVFPEILRHKAPGAPIRIWVAGCSTGEEVYSLAILLLDFLGDSPSHHPIQIFGTDVSDQAIQVARTGRCNDSALRAVSEEQRSRYFTKLDPGFRVNKNVRDLCVFVRHDLARDPPFSKLDLVSCRNVLIYFDHQLQKRVIPTFHYSLNQPGFLLLGRTENIGGFGRLFSPIDAAHKIFARSATPSGLRFLPRSDTPSLQARSTALVAAPYPRRTVDISRQVDNLLLARYAPPGVLINDRLEVLLFRGQTGAFLQPAPGEPQNNLVQMARGGLLAKLRSTLARARKERAPVRTEGVPVDQNGYSRTCDIVVMPFTGLPDVKERLFIVLFEEVGPARTRTRTTTGSHSRAVGRRDAGRIPTLEHELSATTEYLHSLIEEHSRTNDDLGSANEELVSGNEELQSLNEELETAKEELQSSNEELITVNDELNARNGEVSQVNTDLVNLLNIVEVPILILDKLRRIRRFTPSARSILNVLPSDVGRPLGDIRWNIDVPDLDQQIAEAIENVVVRESDVRDGNGRWYRLQIRPLKTSEERADGAIISLFDIDSLKHRINEVQKAREEAERADQAKDQFLAVLSHELRTPLAALLIQTQLLRQSGSNEARRERACDAIEHCTDMQVRLIEDLLDVSRIVTGKLKVTLEPVDLVEIVKTTIDTMGEMARSKEIDLRMFLDNELSPVAGDRSRLEQIVSNLVTNAIKFTPRDGWVHVVLEKTAGLACLRVSDNGIGIDSHFLPRIFNRLTQKDSSSTRTQGGLGLGLAIVRHLVDAHGGTVRAESPGAGLGSTFQITLPLLANPFRPPVEARTTAPLPEIPIAGDDDEAPGRFTGRRILLVEDDAPTREALSEVFAAEGAKVRTADSASSGIAEMEGFRPHVLICDLAMPIEDGYALVRKVRALPPDQGGNTPALALTARAGDSERRRALSEGFQAYVVKPVEIRRLVEAVAEILKSG